MRYKALLLCLLLPLAAHADALSAGEMSLVWLVIAVITGGISSAIYMINILKVNSLAEADGYSSKPLAVIIAACFLLQLVLPGQGGLQLGEYYSLSYFMRQAWWLNICFVLLHAGFVVVVIRACIIASRKIDTLDQDPE